ncbi:hypothetical protein BU16DRAFT_580145 [Lophium mytilinum]|uniref:C3H1-type domain-containing protein n=1 Tax=Lophium mytilinum TaxID=390894 RepID=A0A6A6QYG0_9PEZI|nr:hypothetical protein BU16DRAFT_580145 [Lophium mytilinum]
MQHHLAANTDASYVPFERSSSGSSDSSSELEAGEIRDTHTETEKPDRKADNRPNRSSDTSRPNSRREQSIENAVSAGRMDGQRISRAPSTRLKRPHHETFSIPSMNTAPRSEDGRAQLSGAPPTSLSGRARMSLAPSTRLERSDSDLEGLTSPSQTKTPPSYIEPDELPPTKRPCLAISPEQKYVAPYRPITLGVNPRTGGSLLYREGLPMTCFYFMQKGCFRTAENCKYAHWDTGEYSEEPFTTSWKMQMQDVKTAHMNSKGENESSSFQNPSARHSQKPPPSKPKIELRSKIRHPGASRMHRGRGHRHMDSPPPLGPPLKATPEASHSQSYQAELLEIDRLLAERKAVVSALEALNCSPSASNLRIQTPVANPPEHDVTNTGMMNTDMTDTGMTEYGKQKQELRKWEQRLRDWEKVLGGREEAVIAEEERLGDWEGLLGLREERLRGRG